MLKFIKLQNIKSLKNSKNEINYLLRKMINNNPINNTTSNTEKYKLFDIAANLSDEKFQGIYNGKRYHEDDTNEVISRAENYGVRSMLFASGTIEDLHCSYKLCKQSTGFYTTLGIHPCRATVNKLF